MTNRHPLPPRLAHPLLDERAVARHAVGSSLEGRRQNGGEFGRLLRVKIPG